MKILFITSSPMRSDNSIGNTYANLFEALGDKCDFYSLYCRSQLPDNGYIKRYFQITEKQILLSLLNSSNLVGREFTEIAETSDNKTEKIDFIKKACLKNFWLLKELIWRTNKWKNKNLNNFLDNCNPDIIFAPLVANTELNNIILYAKKQLGCKLVTYGWDDEYTLNQFSVSPMYWIKRLYKRKSLRKVALNSDKIYVISKQQKEVYDKCFNKDCVILTKGGDFDLKPTYSQNEIIKFVYTGNLGTNRWKSLVVLGNALKKINEDTVKAQLFIYSQTALTKKAIDCMNIENTSFFMGRVSHNEAIAEQASADVLLHVESFKLKARKQVRLSFSTKLVDYFHQAKCIFAVGPSEVSSMDYLIKNDAAITAVNKKEIEEKLRMIIESPEIIKEYRSKAWECGKRNHQIEKIQHDLYCDFKEILNENSSN